MPTLDPAAISAGRLASRGAALFESVAGSGGPYRQLVANLRATPHFQTLTALPDIADLDQPWAVWDETTMLDLQLWTEDSLESLTEQEVLAGHNLLLIGRELVQFSPPPASAPAAGGSPASCAAATAPSG